MANKWHNKHIPTKWGVGILGVLIVGLIIFITQVNQNQIFSSHAAVYDRPTKTGAFFYNSQFSGRVNQQISIPIFISVTQDRLISRGQITVLVPSKYFSYVGFSAASGIAKNWAHYTSSSRISTTQFLVDVDFQTTNGKSIGTNRKIGTLTLKAKKVGSPYIEVYKQPFSENTHAYRTAKVIIR